MVIKGSYTAGLSTLAARRSRGMCILMYHTVGRAQAEEFEKQLVYLAERFPVVPLRTIVEKVSEPARRMAGEIALTFDDGSRTHHTVVYPILKRLNLPATFFVCPRLIESGRWLWNHEVRARLRGAPAARVAEMSRVLGSPGETVEEVIAWMKILPLEMRLAAEEKIRTASPQFKPTEKDREDFDLMTWEEIASLDPYLITIGSHTISHPILTGLNEQEIQVEVRESRTQLEKRLGRPVEYFCYPNGCYDERALRHVQEIYRAAVTTKSGRVLPGQNAHELRRTPSADDLPLLAWRMHRPEA